MSVFSKLKQFKDLRDQGKKLQDSLAGESATTSSGGVTLSMDGNFKLTGVAIDEDLLNVNKKEKLQNAIKDAHDDAIKKMQRIMAGKMQEMGGMESLFPKK